MAGKSWQWTMIGVALIAREPLQRNIARTDIQKLLCILDVDALSFPPQNKNPQFALTSISPINSLIASYLSLSDSIPAIQRRVFPHPSPFP